ncbi:hypothetical protein ATANTOWER_024785 [Ataeniobius toweri]|uniref:Uncharacterized protein n=1 Tax=Ataeniobius toweri TaxID=208326 RepID=A0ABU7BUC8_9TELE|nr:hypothetical protein [Ataeniobius toweri]
MKVLVVQVVAAAVGKLQTEETGTKRSKENVSSQRFLKNYKDRYSQDEFRVIMKLKEGSFHSMNPLRLAGRLKDELGRIKDAQILNDGKLLIFCTSASQAATAAGLKVLEDDRLKVLFWERRLRALKEWCMEYLLRSQWKS